MGRWVRLGVAALLLGVVLGALFGRLPATAARKLTFVYVHDRGNPTSRVFGYSMDALGNLAALPGSPYTGGNNGFGCGGNCQTAAYSVRRQLLFASASTGVAVFRVAADGTLSPVPGSPFGPGGNITGTGVVEKGKETFVYVSDFSNDQILGYRVQQDDSLSLLPTSPYPAGNGPDGLTAARDLVFAANESDPVETVSAYRAGTDGALVAAPGSPFAVGDVPSFFYNLQLDPSGSTLYVPLDDATRLLAFRVNKRDASITPLPSSPVNVNLSEPNIGSAVSARLVIVPSDNAGTNDVQVFRRKKNGALEPLGEVQSSGLSAPSSSAVDRAGRRFVLADEGTDSVGSYLVNARTGELTPVSAVPADGGQRFNQVLVVQR